MKIQRLRVTFTRGDDMKYITHLDMMRFWERALRRAEIPVFYSEGFSPHPQIALASPLAVGTTSDCELLDIFLERRITPRAFIDAITPQLPPAITVTGAREAGLTLPSLQAEVRAAEYEVDAPLPVGHNIDASIHDLLAAESIPWEHKREDEIKQYDLRPLILELEVISPKAPSNHVAQPPLGESPGRLAVIDKSTLVRLRMLLRNDSTSGSGRPEQVALALGLGAPLRIHRTRLVLAARSPAREAIRKHGRFA
jgi:radical SAM-linked protein